VLEHAVESAALPVPEPAQPSREEYITKRKRKLTGKRLETFNRFWQAFALPKGKAAAADAWLDIPEFTDSLVEQIVAAAKREAQHRRRLMVAGRTPKWAQGWLTERRWEDGEEPAAIVPMSKAEQRLAGNIAAAEAFVHESAEFGGWQ
jgi:hypothetical protein